MRAIIQERVHEVVHDGNRWLIDGRPAPEILQSFPDGRLVVREDGRIRTVSILKVSKDRKQMEIGIGASVRTVRLMDRSDEILASLIGPESASATKVEVKAPMPGLIVDVLVQAGDTVKAGDPLVVLEAMKMENLIKAPAGATIREVRVAKGDRLEKGQMMIVC